MSEKIESHEKLVECGVLDLMVTILKETKHPKLYRQVRFNLKPKLIP